MDYFVAALIAFNVLWAGANWWAQRRLRRTHLLMLEFRAMLDLKEQELIAIAARNLILDFARGLRG